MQARLRTAVEALALIAVLGFVASVAYLPHADSASRADSHDLGLVGLAKAYGRWLYTKSADDYEYTVHVDENAHWVSMASLERAQSLRYPDPYSGSPATDVPLSLRGLIHERGFHVAVATFQEVTGIEWLTLFRFLPALWAVVTAWMMWAALRPSPSALPAALFVALIPTSARFLGPGFMVPIGFGLAWIAAAILLQEEAGRKAGTMMLLLLLVTWAFFIHLIAGFACALVVFAGMPFARRGGTGYLMLALASLAPVAWLQQSFQENFNDEISHLGTLPIDLTIFDQLGTPFLALWIVGCAWSVLRPPQEARMQLLGCTLGSMVAFGLIVTNLAGHFQLYAAYDRWHPVFALLAVAPAAHGLAGIAGWSMKRWQTSSAWLRGSRERWRKIPTLGASIAVSIVACFLALGISDVGIAGHVREPYYHVIDNADWANFHAGASVNGTYQVFLGHPWKSVIFAAVSGKIPHTYLIPGVPPIRGEDYVEYVSGQHGDAVWLVSHGVSMVVDPVQPTTALYVPAGPGVSLLDYDEAVQLAELDQQARGT